MEELWELRRYVQAGDVDAALALLDEMEEMSRDDKITRIRSYMAEQLRSMHDAEVLWQEALRLIEQMQQGQGR